MKFTAKKIENCFRGASTYEYALPITGEMLIAVLRSERRLVRLDYTDTDYFLAELTDRTRIKGFNGDKTSKVSFIKGEVERAKADYEDFLASH